MNTNCTAHRLCDFITKHGGVVALNNSAFAEFCRMVLDIWDKGRKDNKAEVGRLQAELDWCHKHLSVAHERINPGVPAPDWSTVYASLYEAAKAAEGK